jgi:hypothetical protein
MIGFSHRFIQSDSSKNAGLAVEALSNKGQGGSKSFLPKMRDRTLQNAKL